MMKRTRVKRPFTFLLALVMLFSLLPATALARDTHTEQAVAAQDTDSTDAGKDSGDGTALLATDGEAVQTFDELEAAISAFNGGRENKTITVSGEIAINAELPTISNSGRTLTITGGLLTRAIPDTYLLRIENSANLVLKEIILDGQKQIYDTNTRALIDVKGTLTMEDGAILRNNRGETYGGGVYVGARGNITMNGGEITGNTAIGSGGGVYVYMYMNGSMIMNGGEISGNTATSSGGGVYAYKGSATSGNAGKFTINGGKTTGNTAGNGGGVYISGSMTMSKGEISGNKATSGGGGIYVSSDGDLTILNGVLTGNAATSGGGVSAYGTATLRHCDISGNTATRGGGVRTGNGSVSMEDVQINDNMASDSGGGVYIYSNTNSGSVSMVDVQITDNSAADGGGAYVSGGSTSMAGVQIIDNEASNSGGGINLGDIYSGIVSMESGEISGNTATNNGGGVSITRGSMTMRGGEVTDNAAVTNGGGVYVNGSSCSFILSDGKIANNTAYSGGGVYAAGGQYTYSPDNFVMEGGAVTGNAAIYGAGVYLQYGNITMSGGEIFDNTAGANGGGVMLGDYGRFTMEDGRIIGNVSKYSAGGVHLVSAGQLIMNSGVIFGAGSSNDSVVYPSTWAPSETGLLIRWDSSSTANQPYLPGTNDDLIVLPASGASVQWSFRADGVPGILYENGTNTGFIPVADANLLNAEVPTISKQPMGGNVEVDEAITLAVDAGVSDGGTLSYQWFRSETDTVTGGTAIEGATESSYAPPTSAVGTMYYYVIITNTGASGNQAAMKTSAAAAVTVYLERVDAEVPTISKQPMGGNVEVDEAITLAVDAGVSDGGALTYQWYRNETDSVTDGTVIAGATGSSYAPSTDTPGTVYYYVVVTNTNSSVYGSQTTTATSTAAAVTVYLKRVDAEVPTISKQPMGGNVEVDEAVTLAVDAGVSDGGALTYQWYRNETDSVTDGTVIAGATGSSYAPSTDTPGTVYYYVVVTNTNGSVNGSQTATAISAAAAVTVTAEYHAVSIPTYPKRANLTIKDSSNIIESNGDGTYDLADGTYDYVATMPGYKNATGSFTVENGELKGLETITLTAAVNLDMFTDVNTGLWYKNAVEYSVANNLFSGTGDTTWEPDTALTRAMFVTVLGKYSGIEGDAFATCVFDDVDDGAWYTAFVQWAYEEKLVEGTGNGNFSPNESITRQEMAVIFWKYARDNGADLTMDGAAFDDFADAGDTATWAVEALTWATDKGIINGYDGRLMPKDTASRSQAAQIFMRIIEDILP